RLEYIKFIPASILDIGSGVEIDASALKTKFKQAKLYKLDFALNMIKKYRHQDNLLKNIFNPSTLNVCADALNLPIQENSIDMVWSNLCLPLIDDMDKFFNEIYRVLNYSGFFLISGLGVDSLEQLRQLGLKTFNFPDMHLIGDLLVKNNFSHAVTDVEKITLEYKDSATLFNDLKLINFLNPQTETNWLGKNKYNHLKNEIERQLKNDSFKITLEIFYAHAWKEEPLPKNNFAQKAIKIYPRKTK
ncbi:MAG: methyltransferase domain-containing protein, partial [Burkholderiales bacterium]|nr:methyltransferase domain-containing protein [Burkholderiales bacterium]